MTSSDYNHLQELDEKTKYGLTKALIGLGKHSNSLKVFNYRQILCSSREQKESNGWI